MIRIKRGLRLPIAGEPAQVIEPGRPVSRVALVAADYVGLRPALQVAEGDVVRRGQLLFRDRSCPAVGYTAPASGRVATIARGERRAFQSLTIEVAGSEQEPFAAYTVSKLDSLDRSAVVDHLVRSGLWTSLRTRPYSKVPDPGSVPAALFVTAIDTQPLAASPAVVLAEHREEFVWGLRVLRHLTPGPLFLCQGPGPDLLGAELDFVTMARFAGPHPAGLPGTHIHFLRPASERHRVWHLAYPDVIAIGKLFVTGELSCDRIVSLAGPAVTRPRLVRTVLGAHLGDLTQGELADEACRVISGSVLSGRTATPPVDYLGRYHGQVSALPAGGQREFLGWHRPGWHKFSVKRVFASALLGRRDFRFTTSLEGSRRAMVPVGSYEQVMPLDVEPSYLLRALITGDTEQARLLGCLELDEEDLALCTFVCPGKYEYGPLLRQVLTEIEKD